MESVAAASYEWAEITVKFHGPKLIKGRGSLIGVAEERRRVLLFTGVRPPGPQLYEPLGKEYRGLYRIFARTPPTEEGVAGFANAYGWLGLANGESLEAQWETLDQWQLEIGRMRECVDAIDAIQHKDPKRLSSSRLWLAKKLAAANDGRIRRDPKSPLRRWAQKAIAQAKAHDIERERCGGQASPVYAPGYPCPSEDTASLTRWWTEVAEELRETVNQKLTRLEVRPMLLWQAPAPDDARYLDNVRAPGDIPVKLNDDFLQFQPAVPVNLLGALWLQLAEDIPGLGHSSRLRECPVCYEQFDAAVSYDGTRERTRRAYETRRYCSAACKLKASRDKRRQTK